jgi:hypothetical protein
MRYLSYVAEQQEKDHLMMKQSALADANQVHTLPPRLQLKAAGGQSG